MQKNYTKMSRTRLLREFEKEKANWKSLPRKSSFSGLAISERLEKIQQLMEKRGYDFNPIYMEINMFGWFMKKIINSYYELTVIPSIVLGAITNLGWYILGRDITPSDTIFAFGFFLVLMTVEDIAKAMVKRIKKQ